MQSGDGVNRGYYRSGGSGRVGNDRRVSIQMNDQAGRGKWQETG